MKTKHILIIAAIIPLILSSCFRDELFDRPAPGPEPEPEPEPEPIAQTITVTADWSGISQETSVPESYNIVLGDRVLSVSEATTVIDGPFAPGQYDLLLHNSPAGFTVTGDNAKVNSMLAEGEIESMPGYLFSGRKSDLIIEKDGSAEVTVKMKQHVRRLNIELTVVSGDHSRIVSATASLSGIESGINHRTHERSSLPAVVSGTYNKDGNRLTLSYNLLGVVYSAGPRLVTILTFSDGVTQSVESDLSESLRSFHDDVAPLTLKASLSVPDKAGLKATITDWKEIDGGNVDAN